MFYHISEYLVEKFGCNNLDAMSNISLRAILAIIIALFIAIVFGGKVINYLKRKQIGETVRNLGLEGQIQKNDTPTMGGVIIILSFVVPVLLFANLSNVYIQVMLSRKIRMA